MEEHDKDLNTIDDQPTCWQNQLRGKNTCRLCVFVWKSSFSSDSEGVMISQKTTLLEPWDPSRIIIYRENLPINWKYPVSVQNDPTKHEKNTDFLTPSSKENDGGLLPEPSKPQSLAPNFQHFSKLHHCRRATEVGTTIKCGPQISFLGTRREKSFCHFEKCDVILSSRRKNRKWSMNRCKFHASDCQILSVRSPGKITAGTWKNILKWEGTSSSKPSFVCLLPYKNFGCSSKGHICFQTLLCCEHFRDKSYRSSVWMAKCASNAMVMMVLPKPILSDSRAHGVQWSCAFQCDMSLIGGRTDDLNTETKECVPIEKGCRGVP